MIWWGTFSPEGRYEAYCSNESGQWAVYVQSFPAGGGKTKVSQDGGTQPRWGKNGKELFYVERDSLIAVAIDTTPSFAIRNYTRLFSNEYLARPWPVPAYDVSADGQRFVLIEPVGGALPFTIRVVQNWYEEFRNQQ